MSWSGIATPSLPESFLACLLEATRRVGVGEAARSEISWRWTADGGVAPRDIPEFCRAAGVAVRLPPPEGADARIHSYPMIRVAGSRSVLLLGTSGKDRVVVWDPETGDESRVRPAIDHRSQLFEISRAVRFGDRTTKFGFRDIARSIDRFWANTVNVLLLSALLQICAFLGPVFVQFIVDDVIPTFDTDLLGVLLLGFILIAVVQHLTDALRTATIAQFSSSGAYQLTGGMISHLFRLPVSYFRNRAPGDILMRVSAMVGLQDVTSKGFVAAIVDGLMALLTATILFVYSWKLTLVVIGGIAVHSLVTVLFQPVNRRMHERQMELSGAEQSHLIETVRAIETVRVAGVESVREDGWLTVLRKMTQVAIDQIRVQMAAGFVQKLTGSIQHLLVLYFGALAVMESSMTLGMLFAFLAFRTLFTDRVTALIGQISSFRLMSVNFERVSDIVDRGEEDIPEWKASSAQRPALVVSGVSYAADDRPILRNVTFSVPPGTCVGITGPSGGGKTTLVKIILGLIKADQGRVALGDLVLEPGSLRHVRSHMAAVLQDEHLFEGTIRDNVTFFRREYDDEDVRSALRVAEVLDEVSARPGGLDARLGPGGVGLSGGQRQRIGIARAVYNCGGLIIFDEATSNLDPGTARKILINLRERGVSVLAITHQAELIELMDVHYILNGGSLERP